MFDVLKNGDIVITDNKKQILEHLKKSKKFLNLKIMNLKEFKDRYFGYYDERAIYYLIKKYNYKYEIAKMYLDNFLFIDNLKKELAENNLIIEEPLFKRSIKRIVLVDLKIDPYIEKYLKEYPVLYLSADKKNYTPTIYEFENIESEINFVALEIIKLLKSVNIDKIHLVNVGGEYKNILKRTFSLYKIPYDLNSKKSIYGTDLCKEFIKKLDNSLEQAIEILRNDDVSNTIIDIVNKYRFTNYDEIVKQCIIQELKTKKIQYNKKDNIIDLVNIKDIDNDDFYIIMNFNQGVIPMIFKDEDYLSDKQKDNYGIFTSLDKNKTEKELVLSKIKNYKNIIITYTENEDKLYYKSSLLNDFSVLKPNIQDYAHSNLYNKLKLATMLDDYIKYNVYNPDLEKLFNNYKDINYLTYDNSYKKINTQNFKKLIDNKLILSYSSLDNFYKCKFRYYINNILRLNKYEDTFMTFIGNLFHDILSKSFLDNFNFEKEFNEYIKDKNFKDSEKFFLTKLKSDLLFVINIINKQEEYSTLNNSLYEEEIIVNKDSDIKITFMGKIDKIKYLKENDKTIVQIVDYKTGNPNIDINNLIYGLDMQLPIYLYLINNSNLINIEIAGFYLQKIIPKKLKYEPGKDYQEQLEKTYRLEGYSNSNTDVLSKLDNSYTDSKIIKGMKVSSNGFYAYSKVLNNSQMNKITDIVSTNIDNAIKDIENTDFSINPKKIDDELIGCKYCKFKDICFRKEEDIITLETQNYKDFLNKELNENNKTTND